MARDLSYAKTQRIVLLIDLNPLLYLPDPDCYIAAVISTAEKIISFSCLSSSLFSFKLFFSSLSPLFSSSKLSHFSLPSPSLSFDFPGPTLTSLSRGFDALKLSELRSSSTTSSRGVHVAASMRQIVYDYAWELVVRDPVIGTVGGFSDNGFDFVRSNLVLLFSPISRGLKWVSEFFDVRIDDECLTDLNLLKSKFGGIFDGVNDLYASRDIHLSWVEVKCKVGSAERSDPNMKLGFFENGIKELNWGFCSTDSIILGSSFVPFGLIYPAIGTSSKALSFSEDCIKFHVQTSLEILDDNGEPVECKCGELELVYSELFCGKRSYESVNSGWRCQKLCKESILEQIHDGINKLNIKAVRMCDELMELESYKSETFVVCEGSGESDQGQNQESEFFADKVLRILARETDERVARKSLPIWQIILSFLYREGYWALVSLSNSNGGSWTGIFKPFSFYSALVSVIGNGVSPQIVKQERHEIKVKSSDYKRKTSKKNLKLLQDITWAEFCESVSNYTETDLEDVYFAKFSNFKKVKFLKCWMKQIKKLGCCSLALTNSCNVLEEVEADTKEEKNNLCEETDQSIPLSESEEDIVLTGSSSTARYNNDAPTFASESSESFFSNLPSKIKQVIESGELDLATMAERLVNSCIFYLRQQLDKDNNHESGTSVWKTKDVAYVSMVTEELTLLLLKDPKDLLSKHKMKDSSSETSELKSAETTPNNVREYELQIFFRMEILGSEGMGIADPLKQKFVKHICLLLEAIQCHLDGGFFGDWSLEKYVDKTIKARYHHILGEIVDRIYTKMDLLLFTDEELPDSFLNSEESNQSGREKQHNDLKNDYLEVKEEAFAIHSKTLLQGSTEECGNTSSKRDGEDRKLLEAKEREERSRRFAGYWMRLQRVWAPKQGKTLKTKAYQKQRVTKRKDRQGTKGEDTVCETPMTGNKRSCSRTDNSKDNDHHGCGTQLCGSISKALFQDDP